MPMLPPSPIPWPNWAPGRSSPRVPVSNNSPFGDDDDDDFEGLAEIEDDHDHQNRGRFEEEEFEDDEDDEDGEDDDDAEEPPDEQPQPDFLPEQPPRHLAVHPILYRGNQDQEQQQQQQQHQQQQQQQQQQQRIPPPIVCVSCKETYTPRRAGTCRECYEEASETEEALRKEIEDLTTRIAFLKSWAPEAMGENCTDIVLETADGSKIRAHRAVLVSRSSVFKAMLDNEMEESRSGTIKITDFSYEVLRLFVHYLYTAEVYPQSLEECAFDLLALAEKYNVKHLKSVCEGYMTSKVNNHNALFSYEYACQHGAKALKEAALGTILENIHELPKKDEYRDLVNRDAKLIVEIFESFLAKENVGSS